MDRTEEVYVSVTLKKIAKHAVSFQIKNIIQKKYNNLLGPKILQYDKGVNRMT